MKEIKSYINIKFEAKLIRVFYAILTKGMEYDRFKMMSDIHRSSELKAALTFFIGQ